MRHVGCYLVGVVATASTFTVLETIEEAPDIFFPRRRYSMRAIAPLQSLGCLLAEASVESKQQERTLPTQRQQQEIPSWLPIGCPR